MTRRGFALLAALWVIALLTVLGGAAVAVARTGSEATRNRVLLARAGWAREACAEILLARYAQDAGVRALDTVDLGRRTWCRATVDDPGAKLNVNRAGQPALRALLAAVTRRPAAVVDSLADALVRWRDSTTVAGSVGVGTSANGDGPLAAVEELSFVRGFNDTLVARLSTVLTTRGSGVVNVNAAPAVVLVTLPGLGEEAVDLLLHRRAEGQPLRSADELMALLSPSARMMLSANYPEFQRAATFAPPELIAVVDGGVRGTPLVARVTLTTVPLPDRLAVVQRETE